MATTSNEETAIVAYRQPPESTNADDAAPELEGTMFDVRMACLVGFNTQVKTDVGTSRRLRILLAPKPLGSDLAKRTFPFTGNNDDANSLGQKLLLFSPELAVHNAQIYTGLRRKEPVAGTYPPYKVSDEFDMTLKDGKYKISLGGSALMSMSKDGKVNFAQTYNEAYNGPRAVRWWLDLERLLLTLAFYNATVAIKAKTAVRKNAIMAMARTTEDRPEWKEYLTLPNGVSMLEPEVEERIADDKEFRDAFNQQFLHEFIAGAPASVFVPGDKQVEKLVGKVKVKHYEEFETGEWVPISDLRFREGTPKHWFVNFDRAIYINTPKAGPLPTSAASQQVKDGQKAAAAAAAAARNKDDGKHPSTTTQTADPNSEPGADRSNENKADRTSEAPDSKYWIRDYVGPLHVDKKIMSALPISVVSTEIIQVVRNGQLVEKMEKKSIDVTTHPWTHSLLFTTDDKGKPLSNDVLNEGTRIVQRRGGPLVPGDIAQVQFIPEVKDGDRCSVQYTLVKVVRVDEGPGLPDPGKTPDAPANRMLAAHRAANGFDADGYRVVGFAALPPPPPLSGRQITYTHEDTDSMIDQHMAEFERKRATGASTYENSSNDVDAKRQKLDDGL